MEGRWVIASMVGGLVFSFAYGAYWFLTPDHAYSVLPADSNGAIMVLDSPETRRLVSANVAELEKAMKSQPTTLVAQGSYARLLEQTETACEAPRSLGAAWARVAITSGPSHGKEGWLCYRRDFAKTAWLLD